MGELKQQQQGCERCPGAARKHGGHAHHRVGRWFCHRQMQAAFPQQLAIAIAQHGA